MGVDFTVHLFDTPRKAVKNIDWIGLGQLETGFIIWTMVDKPFFKLVPNFCQKLLSQVLCQTKSMLPAVTLYVRLLLYMLLCIFAQLFNSRLVRSYSESYAVSSFHLKTSPRSHFIQCIAENSCSQEYVDPKNHNAANSNLVIVWNSLAMSSTHLKLGFHRFCDVLSLEYARNFDLLTQYI